MMANQFNLQGMDQILRTLNQIGKLSQKCVNKSAKSGATIVLNDARTNAPKDKGKLRRGIVLKAEKTSKQGKKVYQVTFNSKYNGIFQKPIKNRSRAKSDIAYYPASQEYGYIAKDGKKIPGKHFMKNALENNKSQVETTMVQVLDTELQKLR